MIFGKYFKQLRKDKGFTQEQVSAIIGKSKMLVSGVETGRNDAFVDEDLEAIANGFHLSQEERSKLFFEASKAREHIPSYIRDYMNEHEDAYAILDIMSNEGMSSDVLKRIKKFVEDINDDKND